MQFTSWPVNPETTAVYLIGYHAGLIPIFLIVHLKAIFYSEFVGIYIYDFSIPHLKYICAMVNWLSPSNQML
jgi:hypothetical protein